MTESLSVDTDAAAARIGVSPRTLGNWRVIGSGPPYVKLGPKMVRYRVADLDAWMAARVVNSTSQPVAA